MRLFECGQHFLFCLSAKQLVEMMALNVAEREQRAADKVGTGMVERFQADNPHVIV